MARGDVLALGSTDLGGVETASDGFESRVIDPSLPILPPPEFEPDQPTPILTPEQEEFYYSTPSPFLESRALPGTNSQISMSQIRAEVSGSGQCSLNDADFRALINKSSGQQQAMSEYWGKSAEINFGENVAAQGGFGSIGGGPNYDYGTTGNASRYICGGVKNTTTNSYVPCSYWVYIPVAQQIPQGTVVKLDYSFTHQADDNRYSAASVSVGYLLACPTNLTGTPSFLAPQYNTNQHRFYDAVTLCRTGNNGGKYHENGSEVSISSYSSKSFNTSTYFTWNASNTYTSAGLSFKSTISGFNGYFRSRATVNFKLTEM